jgi:PIN like domain
VTGALFFDRNVPLRAVRALKVVRDDVIEHGELFAQDERDEVIAQQLAQLGHTLVTRDAMMARRPRQRRVLLDAGLHVFVNVDGGNLRLWDFFVVLVRHLDAIQRTVENEPPAIFFFTKTHAPYLRFS